MIITRNLFPIGRYCQQSATAQYRCSYARGHALSGDD
jgi:hypothetical protein